MNEPFNLPVYFNGWEREFKARFERWTTGYRFVVLIGEISVNFEPDHEGNYRALGDGDIEIALLRAIAEKLATLSQASA